MYKNSSSSDSRKAAAGRSVWSRIDGAGCGRAGAGGAGARGWAPLSVRGARRGSRGVSCLGSQCRWCHLPPTLRGNTAVSPASCLSLRLLPSTPRACSCLLCNNNNNFAGEPTVSVALDRTPRHSASSSTSLCSSATFPLPSASSSSYSHAHPSCNALFPEPSSFQSVASTLACLAPLHVCLSRTSSPGVEASRVKVYVSVHGITGTVLTCLRKNIYLKYHPMP